MCGPFRKEQVYFNWLFGPRDAYKRQVNKPIRRGNRLKGTHLYRRSGSTQYFDKRPRGENEIKRNQNATVVIYINKYTIYILYKYTYA